MASSTNEALEKLLDEAGVIRARLSRELNEFARQHSQRVEQLHVKTPYHWVSRDKQPSPPWPGLIAAFLSERLGRIIAPADLGWPGEKVIAVPASHGLDLPWDVHGGLQAAGLVQHAEGVQRRLFLTLTGASLTAPAHKWLIADPAENSRGASGLSLRGEVVDRFNDATAVLRRMDDHLGGRETLGMVRQTLGAVVNLLTDRSYTDSVGRRLHSCAGELLRLAGWLCFDDNQHPQAQRFWIAALHEAHAAGDRGLGANVLGVMSCQAKDLGQTREAVTLAETARAGYPGASPKVAAILQMRAAEAYANDREPTKTRRALDSAFGLLTDASPQHGDPAWTYWMDPAQAHAQAGYSFLRLQDWPRARHHLREALSLQCGDYAREGALRNALLATTYARQPVPDVDAAVELGSRAVQILSGQVGSGRCVKHVHRLLEDLAPYRRNKLVVNLREEVRRLDSE